MLSGRWVVTRHVVRTRWLLGMLSGYWVVTRHVVRALGGY